MSDFKDPPAFTSGDKDNLPGLITKLTQLRSLVQHIIGTQGPNKGQTAWAADGVTGGGSGGGSGGTGGGTGGGGGTVTPDLTPPPTPTGFAVSAAISNLIVTCDNQTYTVGHGHLYSRVYGATYSGTGALPTFASAVLIDTFPGTVDAIAENPNTEWHLWLKWVTNDGVESASPAGGTNGVTATTGQNVTTLLAALTKAAETSSSPYSKIAFRADLFYVGSSAGDAIPFYVSTTSFTQNGVTVPPGVYMTSAFIANGTIANAQIGNLQVDDAKIANANVAKLTAGSLQVGAYIRSTSYVAGSAGWTIEANGNAEFAAASIRGQLLAAQIGAGQVDATKINVTSLSAISATIGTLRTATSGARLEVTSNVIRVYDASNVLRIKLGDLS